MRPDSLRDTQLLAQGKPHGTRIRYMGGCRCLICRAANSRYETERAALRRLGLDNGIVDAGRAMAHLVTLSGEGLGRRAVSAASGVCESMLLEIKQGRRPRIRKETERRILAVNVTAARPRSRIDARPVWKMINSLLKEGFSKAELARRLGYRTPAIQIGRSRVEARTAAKVGRFYKTIMSA